MLYKRHCTEYCFCLLARWVLTSESHEGKQKEQRSTPYLERGVCSLAAENAARQEKNSTVKVTQHEYNGLNDCSIMRDVYLWLLRRKVVEMCEATQADDDGNWRHAVETYAEAADEAVSTDDIVKLYVQFLKLLGEQVTPQLGTIAACLKMYCEDQLENDLQDIHFAPSAAFTGLDVALTRCLTRIEQ